MDKNFKKELGRFLKSTRLNKGINIDTLSKISNIDIWTLKKIELGQIENVFNVFRYIIDAKIEYKEIHKFMEEFDNDICIL